MTQPAPRTLILASEFGAPVAEYLSYALKDVSIPRVFKVCSAPENATLDQLLQEISKSDYVIIIFAGEQDLTVDRASLRLGFFLGASVGRLGTRNVFSFQEKQLQTAGFPELPPEQVINFENTGQEPQAIEVACHPIKSALRKYKAPSPIGTPEFLVPVYMDMTDNDGWHKKLEVSLTTTTIRALDHTMLYTGPGLAKNWMDAAPLGTGTYTSMETVKPLITEVILEHLGKTVCLVDLGVGSGRWGTAILSSLRAHEMRVDFVALDISHEMIAEALDPDPRRGIGSVALRETIGAGGRVVGINGNYTSLRNYRAFLDTFSARKVFLLMGNTLSNEHDEVSALKLIAAGMSPEDMLIVELQLIEEPARTPDEISKIIRESPAMKTFFSGPLLAVGVPEEDIELDVTLETRKDEANGGQCLVHRLRCILQESHLVRHPSFRSKSFSISEGDITMSIIRKYNVSAAKALFPKAGLEIVRALTAPEGTSKNPHHRQIYIVAKRKVFL